MFGSKKKKVTKDELIEDDFGELDAPYRTDERILSDSGVYQIKGASKKNRNWSRNVFKYAIFGVVAVLVLASLNSFRLGAQLSSTNQRIDSVESPTFKTKYDDLGKQVIVSYFAHKDPPTNLLANANWPGVNGSQGNTTGTNTTGNLGSPVNVESLALINAFEVNSNIEEGENGKNASDSFTNPVNEILTYSGIIDGKPYNFTVNLVVPDITSSTTLPYLVSPPVLEPKDIVINADLETDRPSINNSNSENVESIELNESSISTVKEWASAWAQGNSDALKRVTGDGNINHMYRGLGGFKLVGEPTIEWSYQYNGKQTIAPDENIIIARVKFNISKDVSSTAIASTESGSSSANSLNVPQVMDILLTEFDGGSPFLSGWGPGGTWMTLKKYNNAIIVNPKDEEQNQMLEQMQQEASETPTTTESVAPGAPKMTNNRDSSSRDYRKSSTAEKNSDSDESSDNSDETSSKTTSPSGKTKSKGRGNSSDDITSRTTSKDD